eukprot:CAMPEP_0117053426 /NCGR_PEP_ID=MMETSP0472-20121206/36944_1 /TAXON_ID=693140 ORGANISM="Tiarina fusus, Strain LIS" /NCGR_SAMPLE_ID=MMETSP0472 /ASSEMBLY_ACC=CAM_ASM_000603 /LENGTH=160 /DNA_ID=CAMNT_0004768459 /DNA_START=334 /DNA_END=812 /DNA_ORIENTATION=-
MLDRCNFQNSAVVTISQSSERTTTISNSFWYNSLSRALELSGGLYNIESSNITDSQEEYGDGGAIYAYQSVVNLSDVIISNTSSNGNGGAIYIYDSPLTISGSKFVDNTASSDGGAVSIKNCADVYISDTSFISNNASFYGGAIALSVTDGQVYGCSYVA